MNVAITRNPDLFLKKTNRNNLKLHFELKVNKDSQASCWSHKYLYIVVYRWTASAVNDSTKGIASIVYYYVRGDKINYRSNILASHLYEDYLEGGEDWKSVQAKGNSKFYYLCIKARGISQIPEQRLNLSRS